MSITFEQSSTNTKRRYPCGYVGVRNKTMVYDRSGQGLAFLSRQHQSAASLLCTGQGWSRAGVSASSTCAHDPGARSFKETAQKGGRRRELSTIQMNVMSIIGNVYYRYCYLCFELILLSRPMMPIFTILLGDVFFACTISSDSTRFSRCASGLGFSVFVEGVINRSVLSFAS